MNWYINYFEKSTPQQKKLKRLDFLRCLAYLLVIDGKLVGGNNGSDYCFKSDCGTRSKGQTPAQSWKV